MRHVKYEYGADAADGGNRSDCSHFVHDVLNQAGVAVPYITTSQMTGSPYFVPVPASQAEPGDIMVQGAHMGIYNGHLDSEGHPQGYQMGDHGARLAPFGPGGWFANGSRLTFYRVTT